ncbi:MAG TPA: hypothetical protein VEW28_03550, partial [Candidatus Kapabacteria bacterium]|nr:hypothetical protein [Candidatus Kapabacteria bacterium]
GGGSPGGGLPGSSGTLGVDSLARDHFGGGSSGTGGGSFQSNRNKFGIPVPIDQPCSQAINDGLNNLYDELTGKKNPDIKRTLDALKGCGEPMASVINCLTNVDNMQNVVDKIDTDPSVVPKNAIAGHRGRTIYIPCNSFQMMTGASGKQYDPKNYIDAILFHEMSHNCLESLGIAKGDDSEMDAFFLEYLVFGDKKLPPMNDWDP